MLRSKTIVENDPVLREADTESDCLADRAAALDEQKVNEQFDKFQLFHEWHAFVHIFVRLHTKLWFFSYFFHRVKIEWSGSMVCT